MLQFFCYCHKPCQPISFDIFVCGGKNVNKWSFREEKNVYGANFQAFCLSEHQLKRKQSPQPVVDRPTQLIYISDIYRLGPEPIQQLLKLEFSDSVLFFVRGVIWHQPEGYNCNIISQILSFQTHVTALAVGSITSSHSKISAICWYHFFV